MVSSGLLSAQEPQQLATLTPLQAPPPPPSPPPSPRRRDSPRRYRWSWCWQWISVAAIGLLAACYWWQLPLEQLCDNLADVSINRRLRQLIVLLKREECNSKVASRQAEDDNDNVKTRRRLEAQAVQERSTPLLLSSWKGLPLTAHKYHYVVNGDGGTTSSAPPHQLFSTVHCVGENYSPNGEAWKYRSCQFGNLCFVLNDPNSHDNLNLVLFESPEERRLRELLLRARSSNHITISSLLDPARSSLSLGTVSSTPWFPQVVHDAEDDNQHHESPRQQDIHKDNSYYLLPDSTVLVPFSSSSTSSTSSTSVSKMRNVLWDELYPIYTLLSLFGLEEHHELVLLHLGELEKTTATTTTAIERYLPAMGATLITTNVNTNTPPLFLDKTNKNHLICSKHAAAGLGLRRLDDAQTTATETTKETTTTTSSSAEGINLWAFRNFMLRNLGLDKDVKITAGAESPNNPPIIIRVTVRTDRSSTTTLNTGTNPDNPNLLAQMIQNHFSTTSSSAADNNNKKYQVLVEAMDMSSSSNLDLVTTAKILSQTHIFVTAFPVDDLDLVTFLPRGSVVALLLLFDNDDPNNDEAGLASRRWQQQRTKDWELLHSAGYFSVRTLLSSPPNQQEEHEQKEKKKSLEKQLLQLIDNEIEFLLHDK